MIILRAQTPTAIALRAAERIDPFMSKEDLTVIIAGAIEDWIENNVVTLSEDYMVRHFPETINKRREEAAWHHRSLRSITEEISRKRLVELEDFGSERSHGEIERSFRQTVRVVRPNQP